MSKMLISHWLEACRYEDPAAVLWQCPYCRWAMEEYLEDRETPLGNEFNYCPKCGKQVIVEEDE